MAGLDGREVKAISSPAHLSTCRDRNRRFSGTRGRINASNVFSGLLLGEASLPLHPTGRSNCSERHWRLTGDRPPPALSVLLSCGGPVVLSC